MALVALLFAHHTVMGATEPFASIPVAGLSVIERQVRLARNLGVGRVLVLTERMPPLLAAALTRLGGEITVVRDSALLGQSLSDDDQVLVIEEGLLPDPEAAMDFLAGVRTDALAVSVGEPSYAQAERLDATSFWAGIAVYRAPLVRAVSADLGEWDLQSTLLRSAAGEGAPRVTLVDAAPPLSVRDDRDAARAAAVLLESTASPGPTWSSRHVQPIIERFGLRLLLTTRATGGLLWLIAGSSGLLAGLALAAGWLWVGLLLALATPPLAGIAARLVHVRLERCRRPLFDRAMTWFIEPAWYVGLGASLTRGGFGAGLALAALLVAFRWAASRERLLLAAVAGDRPRPASRLERRLDLFGAAPDTLPWLLLIFALVGAWEWGLAAAALAGVLTFFGLQSILLRALRERAADTD